MSDERDEALERADTMLRAEKEHMRFHTSMPKGGILAEYLDHFRHRLAGALRSYAAHELRRAADEMPIVRFAAVRSLRARADELEARE